MVLVANAGYRTRSGTLAHYLSTACPLTFEPVRHSASAHALRRDREPPRPPHDWLLEPIPPPEHFDF
ncbi:unnamed protein product [Colias eurytheme]|nr:unnamed protein product [Colias eurytheme]